MAQSDDKSEIVLKATLEKENAVQGLRELSKQLSDVAKLAASANFGHMFSIGGRRLDVVLPKLSKSVEKTANAVEKSIKKIDETVKQASPTLEFFGKIGTELMQGWTKRIAIFTSYRAIGAISGMFSDAVTSMVELEKEFANIQAITASSNSEMAKLKDTIYTVGTNTRFTVEELAQATVVLGQAGLSANQISSALESVAQLASATGTDLNTSVNVLTSSLSVWNMEADQAARVANTLTVAVNKTKAEIATMANAIQYAGSAAADMGVSFEEFVSIASSVTNAGMKARAVVGTGFRAVLTELTTPTEKLQKVFKKLGISMSDIDIEGRGVTNVLKTLREAGLGAAEAFEGFDRRAASFYLAASSQLDTVNDLREAFLKEGAVMRANEVQMNTFSSQMTRFSNIMKSTTKEAVEPFVAVITKLLKVVNDLLGNGVARLITEFAAVTIAFRGSITLIGYLTAGFVKFIGIMKSVTAAMKISSLAALGFGGALKTIAVGLTGWPIALVVGSIYALIKVFGKAKESLEDIQGRIDEQTQRMSSLSEAYDELIAKQSLYEEDNNALILRVNELNKQFKLQGSALIDLASDYDEVIRKMKELEFESDKEKRKSTEDKMSALLPSAQAGWWDKALSAAGATNTMSGEPASQLFWKIVGATDEELKVARDAIEKMDGKAGETARKIYESALEYMELMDKFQSSMLTEQLKDSVIKATTEADVMSNTALKAYKQNVDNWLSSSGGVFSIDKLYGEESTAIKILKAQLEAVNKEIDVVAEQVKSGKLNADSPAVTSLQKSKVNIEKAIGEITLESSETIGKILKGDLKYAEQAVKQVTKSIRAGFYDRETLLQMAKDAKEGVLKAVNEDLKKRIKDIKYEEGSDLYNKELKKLQFDADTTIAQHVSDLDKAVFDLLHNLEQVSQTFKSARVRMAEIENDLKDRDYGLYRGSNLAISGSEYLPSQMSSYVSGFAQRGAEEVRYKALDWLRSQNQNAVGRYDSEISKNNLVLKNLNSLKEQRNTELAIAKTEGEYLEIKEKIAEIDKQIATGEQLALDLEKERVEKLREIDSITAAIEMKKGREELRSSWAGSFGVGAVDEMNKMYESTRALQNASTAFEELGAVSFTSFTDNFSQAVQDFVNNEKTFSQALKDFIANTLRSISNWLIDMSIKAAIWAALKSNPLTSGFINMIEASSKIANPLLQTAGNATQIGATAVKEEKASGGYVRGGIANRDSVHAMLMPGEFVLKKSSADYLGANFLNSLNNNAAQTMNSISPTVGVIDGKEQSSSVVNVWVVQDEKEAGMGPNDVIATIAKDIRTGGTTKTLIKSIVSGRK